MPQGMRKRMFSSATKIREIPTMAKPKTAQKQERTSGKKKMFEKSLKKHDI
jgi:hypothetical protein